MPGILHEGSVWLLPKLRPHDLCDSGVESPPVVEAHRDPTEVAFPVDAAETAE